MSEQRDLDVLALIDRAADDAPPMGVAPTAVVEGGRRKVRRRRTAAAGMGLGTLALAGALWWGPGQQLLSLPSTAPAGQTTSVEGTGTDGTAPEGTASDGTETDGTETDGTGADGTSTDGTTADRGPVRLTAADGTVFTLTVAGSTVTAEGGGQSYPTTLDPEGGPLATLWGEGRPVFFVRDWDLADPAAARLATRGPEEETVWVLAEGAATVRLGEGTPVTVLLVPPSVTPVGFGEAVDGDIHEVHPGSGAGPSLPLLEGVSIAVEGDDLVASRDGQVLEPLPASLDGEPVADELWAWTDTDGRWLVVGDAEPWREMAPVVRSRDGMLHVRPDLAVHPGTVVAGDRELAATLATAEDTLVGAVAVDGWATGDDAVQVVGAAPVSTVLPQVQGAPNARLALDAASGLWVLHQQSGDPMVAGVADRLMAARQLAGDRYQLVAVLPQASEARIVSLPGGPQLEVEGEQTRIPGTDLALWTVTVELPAGASPLERIGGLDTTGDGQVDVLMGEVATTG